MNYLSRKGFVMSEETIILTSAEVLLHRDFIAESDLQTKVTKRSLFVMTFHFSVKFTLKKIEAL